MNYNRFFVLFVISYLHFFLLKVSFRVKSKEN